ncbi:MAG: sporulation protein YunB [Ruminococcus sp.]|nr:sporulation protein YunB [Ruminococcus sp.]MDE6671284.1 sporulation protein YunB [Ruminococcus sp.]MDE6798538.1 sporulation protein YunB [Ruminococcus sp.]
MKYRKRKFTWYRIFAVTIVIFMILFVIFAVWIDKAVRPVASVQAEHLSLLETNRTVEEAVSEYISTENFSYSDFVTVKYDTSGRVASVEARTQNINKVQSEIALEINSRLEKSVSYATVPVGSLTGSYFLAGKGLKIRLRICPAGKADVRLKSEFTSAGNNQTCHRISAEVTADIKSSLPIYDFSTETSFEFLLAESIIVGEVPEKSICAWNEY